MSCYSRRKEGLEGESYLELRDGVCGHGVERDEDGELLRSASIAQRVGEDEGTCESKGLVNKRSLGGVGRWLLKA